MKPRRRDILAGMTAVSLTVIGLRRSVAQTEPPKEAPTKPGDYKFIFRARVDGKPVQMTYVLILPVGYDTDPSKKHPMLVFTHGAGEVGTDGNGIYALGPAMELSQHHPFKETFPFIFLGPQCPPRGERWDQPQMYKAVSQIIDAAIRSVRVDEDRVYSTGLSMGGKGCWMATMEGASRFAAMAPMCAGTTHPEAGQKLKYVAVWMLAGAEDGDAVTHDAEMWKILQGNLAEVRNTVAPNVGHDVWARFYDSPQFYEWLLMHKRPDAATRAKMESAGPWLEHKQSPPRTTGHYRLDLPTTINGQSVPIICSLFVNRAYSPSGAKSPLLIFLHEYYNIGMVADGLVLHGPAAMLEERGNERFKESFPLSVFCPMIPGGLGDWSKKPVRDAVMSAIGDLLKSMNFDPSRLYLSGLNEGATAAWQLAGEHSERFAAALLIGAPDLPHSATFLPPENARDAKDIPILALSTKVDQIKEKVQGNPLWCAKAIPQNGLTAGTLYRLFKERDYYDWLMKQQKSGSL